MNRQSDRLAKGRDKRPKRQPQLGAYLIITDTKETEENYFKGFKKSIIVSTTKDLLIKVFSEKALNSIIDFAESEKNRDARYREVWIIFDKDQVPNFDALIEEAKSKDMKVGWSNPCFEIWLSSYFGEMKNVGTSGKCCTEFERLLNKYGNKANNSKYKTDTDLYQVLVQYGNEAIAVAKAKSRFQQMDCDCNSKPSEMDACTTVYQLIEEIREKTAGKG